MRWVYGGNTGYLNIRLGINIINQGTRTYFNTRKRDISCATSFVVHRISDPITMVTYYIWNMRHIIVRHTVFILCYDQVTIRYSRNKGMRSIRYGKPITRYGLWIKGAIHIVGSTDVWFVTFIWNICTGQSGSFMFRTNDPVTQSGDTISIINMFRTNGPVTHSIYNVIICNFNRILGTINKGSVRRMKTTGCDLLRCIITEVNRM